MNIQTIFTIIAAVLTVIFAAVVALKTWRGTKKGAYVQPISLGLVIFSGILAFFGTTITCDLIFGIFDGKSMEDLIAMVVNNLGFALDATTQEMLLEFDPNIISYIVAIPVAILAPIVFIIYYLIIKIVSNIIFRIVRTAVKLPKRVDTVGKTVGGTLGAIEGLLVMVIWLVPVISILNMGMTVAAKLDTDDKTTNEIIEVAEDFAESPVLVLTDLAGGNFLSTELSTVNLSNSKINIPAELSNMMDLYLDVMKLMENTGEGGTMDMLTPENEKILNSILKTIEKSEYMPMLLNGAMHVVADMFFGNIDEASTEPQDKIFIALGDLLKTTEEDTVVDDLRTMKELLFYFSDKGVIDALTSGETETVKDVLTQKDGEDTIIRKAISILSSNNRTKGIIKVLNEVSVAIMCESMDFGGEKPPAEVYESLKTGLNDLANLDVNNYETEEEYHEEVKSTLTEKLVENEIELEDEVIDKMAPLVGDYIAKEKENGNLSEEMSDEQVTDILLTYYDAYLQYKDNGTVPDNIPDGLIPGLGDDSDNGGADN